MDEALLENLLDWLRIPSVSTGGGDPRDLHRAAEFVAARVRAAGGEAELEFATAEPSLFDSDLPAVRLAREAIERATGMPCAFATAEDDIHARDESFRLESLELGERASRELLRAFAALPRP